MRYFCTYFDSNYLTRGLAMYASLKRHSGEFQLTILCLDEACRRSLEELALPECRLISLSDLEAADPELLAVKGTRTNVEYYFTLTPCLVRHLLQSVPEGELLTYLDSDLYFYSSPEPVFEELKAGSIGIIAHRFPPEFAHMAVHGIYNVGWVSFRRNGRGRVCSDWWRDSCIAWCYARAEGARYADQGYLNEWPDSFPGTVVIQHLGANVAPWNVGQYEVAADGLNISINGADLIFYHFHALREVDGRLLDSQLSKYGVNLTKEIRGYIYEPYLKALHAGERSLRAASKDGQPGANSAPSEIGFELIPRAGDMDPATQDQGGKIDAYLYGNLVMAEKDRLAKHAVILSFIQSETERSAYIDDLKSRIHFLKVKNHDLERPLILKMAQAGPRLLRLIRKKVIARFVRDCKMQLGKLRQYEPRKMRVERFPVPSRPESDLPSIGIVTPSFMQGRFLERTMQSILSQKYPKLRYVVQDGGSTDETVEIIKSHEAALVRWESAPDGGQSDAIKRGFRDCDGEIMAWLNSDDMLMLGSLRLIGEYFAANPSVDAIYGHRVVIDENDAEVGRWVLPEHDPEILKWADYVPQETLFWRRKLWDKVGGVDTSFRFALDWDLLVRFEAAGAKIIRLPYFLGCFRIHPLQKTSAEMVGSTGDREMARIRQRVHGRIPPHSEVGPRVEKYRARSVRDAYWLSAGVRR